MSEARCLYEIYEVTCDKCKGKYQVMVLPQETILKSTGHKDNLPVVRSPCAHCQVGYADFLGNVANKVKAIKRV